MLSRVQQWLMERAGLEPELLRRDWLNRVIQQRLQQLGIRSEEDYCLLLERDAAERDRIIREVSVGETSLFRYPASYELLVQYLRQRLEQSGRRTGLRMLSVACATGEEAYSMATAALYAGWPGDAVWVDAVDRNAEALAVARQGRYPLRPGRTQIPSWASPWLRIVDDQFCVAAPLKSAVNFVCADAVGADPVLSGRYAVVFCRNLLIYLHDDARRRLIDNLTRWLEPDGLLFVGHAEQPESMRLRFQMVPHAGAFAWRPVAAGPTGEPARAELGHAPVTGPARRSRPLRDGASESGAGTGPSRGAGRAGVPGAERPRGNARAGVTPTRTPDVSLIQQARMAADSGDLDRALAAIQTAMQSSPLAAELYQLLGSVQLSRGCLPEARDALRRAVYLDADHEESLLQLAIVYQRLGDESHAARYRRRAARAHQRKAEGPAT